jgi:hypothetical protein
MLVVDRVSPARWMVKRISMSSASSFRLAIRGRLDEAARRAAAVR